ncbi:MAG TPA: hypothetical protein VM681_10650 [Candidatus Thermoplasmatota archaeon]|nr:hypothetical protein [Candidatus Thermoplasmatota archaeon]
MLQNYVAPSYGYGSDANVNRLIEDTVQIVNDVDTRLQALKIGIAQAFPHLAPHIAASEIQSRMLAARIATPFGAPGVFAPGTLGSPMSAFSPLSGLSPFASASPFVANPYLGSIASTPWANSFARDPRELLLEASRLSALSPFGAASPFPGVSGASPWTPGLTVPGTGSFRLL